MDNALILLVQNVIYHRWGKEYMFWNDIVTFSGKQLVFLLNTTTMNEQTAQNKEKLRSFLEIAIQLIYTKFVFIE